MTFEMKTPSVMCPSDREGVGSWAWRGDAALLVPQKNSHLLEENLATLFQNVFDKFSRVLNLVFFKNWHFC